MNERAQLRATAGRLVQLDPARQAPPHNLPEALASFIGRGRELALLARLARSERLVTLVGPGDVGKSRLALQAARQSLSRHPDGIWLVDLAGLADPSLVPRSVASTLGIVEGPGTAHAARGAGVSSPGVSGRWPAWLPRG